MSRLGGLWALLATGMLAGACGDDDAPDTGDPNGGGTTPCAEDDCSSAGSPTASQAGASNDGGSTPGTSGGAAGGDSSAGMTAGQGASGAGLSSSGSSGEAGTSNEAGAGGEGGAPNPSHVARWLAFDHADGAFAYDTSLFPAALGLFQLGDGDLGDWSPDGSKLLYMDGGDWYVRDMSGESPGPALLLFDPPPASTASLTWSADSRSLTLRSGTNLSVLDPGEAAPPLHALTSSLVASSWAPKGNRLLYLDAAGVHVVEVDGGDPAQPFEVDDSLRRWSPSGSALVGSTPQTGDLYYASLSGSSATLTTLFDAMPEQGSEDALFSPDGSRLAVTLWKDRPNSDAYYIALLPSIGALTSPHAQLENGVNAAARLQPRR